MSQIDEKVEVKRELITLNDDCLVYKLYENQGNLYVISKHFGHIEYV